jgi:VWFA-related protein
MINTSAARVYRGDSLLRHSAASMIALTLLLATLQLAAQSPQPASQSTTPTLHVYSRETIVDVLVTDNKGQPIHGLTQSDFTIEEDGKPQPIRSFVETRKDAPPASSNPTQRPKLPPNTYTNRQPPPATGSSNIILLDALNVDPTDQMRAHQHAATYFNTMPPGTQVALFGLGNGLKILQGFTSDPAALIAAMDDKQNSLLSPASKIAPCNAPKLTLDALRYIAAFVAGIKGRKNLIWFVTDSLPLYDLCDPNLARETFDMLAAAQVAVDPIDVRGVFNAGAQDVSTQLTRIATNTGAQVAAATMGSYINFAAQHLNMEALAERTGGVAYYNTNALDTSIGSAIDSGANYYTLSYVPPIQAYDGRHHTIHVTVNRPHVQLVYRTGYGADDPKDAEAFTHVPTKLASTTPDPADNTMVASMARFAPTATQLLFDVKFAPTTTEPRPTDPPVVGVPAPDFKSKPLTRYDIFYSIPPDQVTFTTAPDGSHNASIQFAVVASDVFSKLVTSVSRTLQLPLSPDEYDQFLLSPFQFLQQIDLPAGQLFVRVGILDEASKKIGTLEIPLTVPKPTKGAP